MTTTTVVGPYEKRYKIGVRRGAHNGRTFSISLPSEVVERHAREAGMTVDKFIDTHQAVIGFGDTPGANVRFERLEHKR